MKFVSLLLIALMGFAEQPVLLAALAKVGDEVITNRDLQIHLFLNEIDNPLAEYMDRRDPVKEITYEHLIVKEAQSLMAVKVSEGELQTAESKISKKLQNDQLWKSLTVSKRELSQQLERKILVKQLLLIKMPKDLLTITDSAVESYYMQNRNQLGQRPIDEVRGQIEKALKAIKTQERFRDWMTAIKRTHNVVYYSGYKIQ